MISTRLHRTELASVRSKGLLPLDPLTRRARLRRALSLDPRWLNVSNELERAIQEFGQGRAGGRAGQVHLTLSQSGLLRGFNHYLRYGAEFDQHVAHHLLGNVGLQLLAQDGKARLITVAVPGSAALAAAHPFFSIEDLRTEGQVPNIAREFLNAWAYRLAHPTFQASGLRIAACFFVHRYRRDGSWISRLFGGSDQKTPPGIRRVAAPRSIRR